MLEIGMLGLENRTSPLMMAKLQIFIQIMEVSEKFITHFDFCLHCNKCKGVNMLFVIKQFILRNSSY
jgi:hypothetical protein